MMVEERNIFLPTLLGGVALGLAYIASTILLHSPLEIASLAAHPNGVAQTAPAIPRPLLGLRPAGSPRVTALNALRDAPLLEGPVAGPPAPPGGVRSMLSPGLTAVAAMVAGATVGGALGRRPRRPRPPMTLLAGGASPEGKALGEVPSMVDALRRTAWVPFVEDQMGRPVVSQLGGSPLLPEGEPWPQCGACRRPLTLFLQLDLTTIPADMQSTVGDEGILQVFACASPQSDCLASERDRTSLPPADAPVPYLARVIPKTASLRPASDKLGDPHLEPLSITYWHSVDDYPRTVEELLLVYPRLAGSPNLAAWDRSNCAWGEKMGGWPLWGESPRYMRCPDCDCEMVVLFQFDSDSNLDFTWGRGGLAFLHGCTHCKRLGFSWVEGASR